MIYKSIFALVLSSLFAFGEETYDISLGTFSIQQYGLNSMYFRSDPSAVQYVEGVINLDSELRWDIDDNLFYFWPNQQPSPFWRIAAENNSQGIIFDMFTQAFANEGATETVAQWFNRHHGSGTCSVFVWVRSFGWYPEGTHAQYWVGMGWQPNQPARGMIPSTERGEMHYLGEIQLIDWVVTSNLGPPPIRIPDKKVKGTFDYKNPNPAGGDPVRVKITAPDGEEETIILQPGQSVTGRYVGTVTGDQTAGGGHPSVVVEKYGGEEVDPDTGETTPKWIDPQAVSVEVTVDEELNQSEEPRETGIDIETIVRQGAPDPAPVDPEEPSPPEPLEPGNTDPNPQTPDGESDPNPNPNLHELNKSIGALGQPLLNIDADLDELIRQGKKREGRDDELNKSVNIGLWEKLALWISRIVQGFERFFSDPAGFISSTFNSSGVWNVWTGLPGYADVAGWAGVMVSARSWEPPKGVIPEEIPFTICGHEFRVPVPYAPIRTVLNLIKIVISALAISFYGRLVYRAMFSGLALAYSTPGSSGSTTVEARPSAAGFSIGSLKAPVIMLLLGMVIIMAVNASFFALASLRAEADQNFLAFLVSLPGMLSDFIQAASSAQMQIGGVSVNFGGGMLEIIGDCLPLGLLFSFCILGPVYVTITIYLPCAIVGSALMWYARSIT